MNILITGAKGQLGNALSIALQSEQLNVTDLPLLDLVSFQDTLAYFLKIKPEIVIHCAALTNVDDCELNSTTAYLANVYSTKNVVNACQITNSTLVYISTDYVFDGQTDHPYQEYDLCRPINIYGKTKWQGEEIVKMHLNKFFIVRTAWLFGDAGHNFIRTVYNAAIEGRTLKIVNDQIGTPTYAGDLATAITQLIRTDAYGIYHITNEGYCNWFEFARQFLDLAGKNEVRIESTTTSALNRPAPRPPYSVLAKVGLDLLKIKMPSYQDALIRFIKKMRHY